MRVFRKLFILPAFLLCGHAANGGQDKAKSASKWTDFYRSKSQIEAANPPKIGQASAVCLREIVAAQKKYSIPDNLLLVIGIQEAGRNSRDGLTVWPWTVNVAGEGRYFDSKAEALRSVKATMAAGTSSIDIGCMQINLKWHKEAFPDAAAGFDPAKNVDYAARFLKSLHKSSGDWLTASVMYHSRNKDRQDIYLKHLKESRRYVQLNLGDIFALAGSALAQNSAKRITPLVFWSAQISMSGTTKTSAYSIYSWNALQPVLPALK